jgi:DNA polymerase III alpha subunit
MAHDLGLSAIALTDHDTTLSHDAMAKACAELGLELIPGVEVSLRDNVFPKVGGRHGAPRNVHVLAYFLPPHPPPPLPK